MSPATPITSGVAPVFGPTPTPRDGSLGPAPGVTPAPAASQPHRFLSDVILERGLVKPAAMRVALQASLTGRSLTEILLANGDLDEDDLAHTLAEHHALDHVDLELFAVDLEAVALVEPGAARRLGAVPIAFLASGAVVVALHEPNGSTAAVELARLTNRTIQPAVASRSQIMALIDALAPRSRSRFAPPSSSPAPDRVGAYAAAPRLSPARADDDAHRPRGAVGPPGVRGAVLRREQLEDELASSRLHAEVAERERREADERAVAARARAQAAEELLAAAQAHAAEVASELVFLRTRVAELEHEIAERSSGGGGASLHVARGLRQMLEVGRRRGC